MNPSAGWLFERLQARGNQLPAADLPLAERRVIVRALEIAWNEIASSLGAALLEWPEDDVTTALWLRLNEMIDDPVPDLPGFSSAWFEHVVRDGKELSYDGSSYEQMPDLTFRLCGPAWRAHQAVACECKHVRPDRDHLRVNYAHEGVRRFAESRYAWGVRSALMVGYVGGGATIAADLVPLLIAFQKRSPDPFATVGSVADGDLGLPTSTHDRAAVAPGGGGKLGPIRLAHLWLRHA